MPKVKIKIRHILQKGNMLLNLILFENYFLFYLLLWWAFKIKLRLFFYSAREVNGRIKEKKTWALKED